jgi:hypothetical protein
MESLIQRSLAGGEIAPALYGRADQTKYQTGAKTLRNIKVRKHGGGTNRAGLQFINEVKTSSLATYLAKFIFNDEQTYVIEVGNGYFRFFRNRARIVVSGVAAYNGATAYVPGDLVSSAGVNYYCIANTTGNAPPNASFWYALTGTIYEIPTPYATADLARLQFTQSGDVITITHPSYDVRELTRTGHTRWVLTTETFAPSIAAPGAPTVTAPGAGLTTWRYRITAVKSETYEESVGGTVGTDTGDAPAAANIHTLTWGAVSGAAEYNVYLEWPTDSGTYAFIGVAATTAFSNNGITPDTSLTPPITRDPFTGANNRPAAAGFYQQRRMFANQNTNTEKIYGSRSGMFANFTISSPLQSDDAVSFTIAGRKVNEVRHLIDLGVLVVLTASGEFLIEGDADGILRGNQPPNPRQIGYNGSSYIVPPIVNDSLIFVQARGSVVRDLRYAVSAPGDQASYKGRDLTVFAGHLFKRKTLTRCDYAQIPDSIVWFIRDDGVLLGLTYLPEHEVWGWHRHDTDGTFEDVCVVPEDSIDAEYFIVKRTINGTTKRYIECFADREFSDIEVDAIFLDSFLSYDGRNTSVDTITLSTGAGWTVDDTITCTMSGAGQFVAADVGNDFILYVDETVDGVTTTHEVAIRVVTYTSATVVSGTPSKTVPTQLRGVATATWTRAVDNVTLVDHLEGEEVAVFGDGNVVANPNNAEYDVITVTAGNVALDRPYGIIHVGLPYVADFQTLDLDVAGQQIRDRHKNVTHIALLVEETRGIWAGPRFPEDIPEDERQDATDLTEGLTEFQPDPIPDYGEPWPLKTGLIEMPIASTWGESGSFVARQIDPLPMTILAAIPAGTIGG